MLGRYEIDIIARKGDTVAFVEVKTRHNDAIGPEESVGPTKRKHIRAAAHRYMAQLDDPELYYRFDVAAVLAGVIDLPNFFDLREFYTAVRWVPQGWDWIDPENEVKAAKDSIDAGLTTHAQVIESSGQGDWRNVFIQREKEDEDKRARGLPTADMGTITTRRNMDDTTTEEEDEEDDNGLPE